MSGAGVKKQKMNGHCPSLSCLSATAVVAPVLLGGQMQDDEMDGRPSTTHSQLTRTNVPRSPKVVSVEMVVFCFDVLHAQLHGNELPKIPKFPNEQFPLFVTWKMGKERKLRGCIGTFNCTSLHHGLREYAVTSAFKDSRFDPICSNELPRLHCSVSLLMDFEIADHYLDWEIGVHGIRIEFSSDKGSKKAATYLPEVAVEQGWNQIQTIDSLLRKGGYRGSITPDIRQQVCVIRFQSDKLTVSYPEYVSHKQQNVSNGDVGGHTARKHTRLFPSLQHRYQTRASTPSSAYQNGHQSTSYPYMPPPPPL